MRRLSTFHPLLQLAMLTTLALLATNLPGTQHYLVTLYSMLLCVWVLALLWVLRDLGDDTHICTQEMSMSVVAALWNTGLALVLGTPIPAGLLTIALGLVAYRGWWCRRHPSAESAVPE